MLVVLTVFRVLVLFCFVLVFFFNKLSIAHGPRSKLQHLCSILSCVCELNLVIDTNLSVIS